ncbi:hypothetical protein FF38_10260 [Lucilia cuprina]|uniref:Uncharacterized protein n=1 Tax=Lucilia cuprina TaxID=7375 RepID=A0A0L0BYX5_LUCCU|nr:hypothetical protein FF38_10260 [Lucilia cuprina]
MGGVTTTNIQHNQNASGQQMLLIDYCQLPGITFDSSVGRAVDCSNNKINAITDWMPLLSEQSLVENISTSIDFNRNTCEQQQRQQQIATFTPFLVFFYFRREKKCQPDKTVSQRPLKKFIANNERKFRASFPIEDDLNQRGLVFRAGLAIESPTYV